MSNELELPESSSELGKPARSTRRKFLTRAGFGSAALAVGPIAVASPVAAMGNGNSGGGNTPAPQRFTRLFPNLEPFAEDSVALQEALLELGKKGGIMDAKDPLEVGPIRLITEPELSPNNRDNPTQTAGTTFVAQFLDHDLTRDGGSTLGSPTSLTKSLNLRTPSFDLDTVYGGDPRTSPELYADSEGHFLVESGGLFEDLPRSSNQSAISGDPRNDENLMISGIQVAMLKFHNNVLDSLDTRLHKNLRAFNEARQIVQWHWQWLVVNEFLPQFVGQEMVDDIFRNGFKVWRTRSAQIPVEFSTAAYRFGHSMVRPSYRANLAGDDGDPFFAFVFDPDSQGAPDPDDLTGGRRSKRRFIGWQTFFDFNDGEVRPNKRIDTMISSALMNLPIPTIDTPHGAAVTGPRSLPARNFLRHITWGIPSGQEIAKQMGVDPLSAGDLRDAADIYAPLGQSTPLFFYILREADVVEDGLHLGPVGGRIVAETFLALLRLNRNSYLSRNRDWKPTLPFEGDRFDMTDLLRFAGVDPATRGQ